jgi:hypothetical protein
MVSYACVKITAGLQYTVVSIPVSRSAGSVFGVWRGGLSFSEFSFLPFSRIKSNQRLKIEHGRLFLCNYEIHNSPHRRVVTAAALLTRVREELGSNFGWDIRYPE